MSMHRSVWVEGMEQQKQQASLSAALLPLSELGAVGRVSHRPEVAAEEALAWSLTLGF
jgi:hypothetical protein